MVKFKTEQINPYSKLLETKDVKSNDKIKFTPTSKIVKEDSFRENTVISTGRIVKFKNV